MSRHHHFLNGNFSAAFQLGLIKPGSLANDGDDPRENIADKIGSEDNLATYYFSRVGYVSLRDFPGGRLKQDLAITEKGITVAALLAVRANGMNFIVIGPATVSGFPSHNQDLLF
jgi:hypothetical protein